MEQYKIIQKIHRPLGILIANCETKIDTTQIISLVKKTQKKLPNKHNITNENIENAIYEVLKKEDPKLAELFLEFDYEKLIS